MTIVSTADLLAILPELLVMTGGCLLLVLDPSTPQHRKDWLTYLSLAILGAAFVVSYWYMGAFAVAPRPASTQIDSESPPTRPPPYVAR